MTDISQTSRSWQPIDSAPKDGTNVMLLCVFDDRREITIARWCDTPAPAGPFGKFCWREMQDSTVAEQVPSHWMPLPEMPA